MRQFRKNPFLSLLQPLAIVLISIHSKREENYKPNEVIPSEASTQINLNYFYY